ncbi:Choline ethanolaminephosphotransferase [Lentinula edodes]|uniref:Choline ethanolaminephosphotransferase n=1 Tax=Lentinula edodes TaxID=5353 RepID=A0A1Q3E3D0_LENED|nr:Choline ethanolaminephosphotransferase [Lentinula edodes]
MYPCIQNPLPLIHSLIHSLMLPIPLPSTQITGNMSYHVYMPIILKELGFKVTERFPIIHLTPSSPLSTSTPPSSFPSLPTREFCVLMIHNIRGFMGIVCFTVRKKDKEGH